MDLDFFSIQIIYICIYIHIYGGLTRDVCWYSYTGHCHGYGVYLVCCKRSLAIFINAYFSKYIVFGD